MGENNILNKGKMPPVPEGFDPEQLGALARQLFEEGDPDWIKAVEADS